MGKTKVIRVVFQLCSIVVLIFALSACSSNEANSDGDSDSSKQAKASDKTGESYDYPEKTLHWTIAFGPGGGNDLMSRTIIDILQKHDLYTKNIVAKNKEGGSGAVGWSYVKQQKGDQYQITSTSGNFIATPLVSNTDWNYDSFTPVGLLAADDEILVVKKGSKYDSVKKLVDAAKDKKIKIGGIGSAGPDRVVVELLADKAGVDFQYVPFQEEGEMNTSLQSGSLDAEFSNPSEIRGMIDAGKLKPIGYSGEKRNHYFPDTPTFKEAGYDFTFSLPRGIVLPADVPKEEQEWWINTLKEVVKTDEWRKYLEKNSMTDQTIWGDDFAKYLKKTNDQFKSALKEAGAIN